MAILNLLNRGGNPDIAPVNPYPEVGSITTIGEPGVEFGADDLYRILLHANPRDFEHVVPEKEGKFITTMPGYGGNLLLRAYALTSGQLESDYSDALQQSNIHYEQLLFLQRCAGRLILPKFTSLLVKHDPYNNNETMHYMAVEQHSNGRTMEGFEHAKPGTRKYTKAIRTATTLDNYYTYRRGTDPYANPFPARPCIDALDDLCQWSRAGKLYDLDPSVYTGDSSFNIRVSCLDNVARWVGEMHPSDEQQVLLEGLEANARFVRQFAYR